MHLLLDADATSVAHIRREVTLVIASGWVSLLWEAVARSGRCLLVLVLHLLGLKNRELGAVGRLDREQERLLVLTLSLAALIPINILEVVVGDIGVL